MMFLQFFIWGAWYTTIAVYMTHHGMETLTHWPYTVNPIAAIVAPFFLGLVADRYFATERVLGMLHLLGGVVMLAVPSATGAPVVFILLLLFYNLCYSSIVGLDALGQLGDRAFYVFIAASLLLCIPLAAYYNFTQIFLGDAGVKKIAATQSLGQMSEVVFMLLMPVFFARLGVKRMLMAGMAAWVLRYALFAIAAPSAVFWLIIIGILLHGVCYDFFFVTGQIYVDKKSTPAVRGQAQGFLVLVTYGIGMLIGAQVAGNVYNRLLGGAAGLTLERWPSFWVLPAGFAAVVLLLFAALFRPGGAPAPPPVAAH